MKYFIQLFLVLELTAVVLAGPKHIYVSLEGNDSSSGTAEKPLKNIQTAIDRANTTTEIIIRGGIYRLEKSLILEKIKNTLTIKPFPGEKVIFNGGVALDVRELKEISDAEVLNRIQTNVRAFVKEIDLSQYVDRISGLRPSGFGRPSLPSWSELFINGSPLEISRWPNDSMVPIGKIEIAGNSEDKAKGRLPVFHYETNRPALWSKAKNIWLRGYFAYGYADDMIPVKKINTEVCTINMADFTTYQFMTGASFRQWCALNLPEEIDIPGEYMIDIEKAKAYLYPPESPVSSIELSIMEHPLVSIIDSRNVTIKGIIFEVSRGMGLYSEGCENILVDGCHFRNLGNVGICLGHGTLSSSGYKLNTHSMEDGGKDAVRLIGDVQGKLYADPLYNRNGGKNITIKNCIINNTGAGGIHLSGGDRRTLERGNQVVKNCRISHYNRIEKSYRPGIWMDGVGNRISNCDIIHAPSMAILFHGNDHIIEQCRIHDVCNEVDDQGAIYYGRDPSERGHVIRYNYFHELSPKHRVTATYHDDGACGSEVYGNIYYRSGSLPVLIGGGHDHNYHGNIFMDVPCAIHLDNRMQGWGSNMIGKGGIVARRLELVKYNEPPYAVRYPELTNYWKENPAIPKRNTIHGNLFYKVRNVLHGNSEWGEFWNNWTTNRDPGFVDPQNPLKGFRKNAEVFKRIPGFPSIPFDKIGCHLD